MPERKADRRFGCARFECARFECAKAKAFSGFQQEAPSAEGGDKAGASIDRNNGAQRGLSLLRTALGLAAAMLFGGIAIFGATAPGGKAIRIDSVDARYQLQEFSFEVNQESGRAGIRLVYANPHTLTGQTEDPGPAPKIVTLPGLTYDAAARAVMYFDGKTHTVCAKEAGRRILFWRTPEMMATGVCTVSSYPADHARDNGWGTDRSRTLDLYFEVTR